MSNGPYTVEPPEKRDTRPADCYDVLDGDLMVLVPSVSFEYATWIANTLNDEVLM